MKKSRKYYAKLYLKNGFNVIPTNDIKLPTTKCGNWSRFQKKPMTEDAFSVLFEEEDNIAVLTGGPTRVVCLDADMKYDLTSDLWERFLATVPITTLDKCMVQKTKNKGYHIVFKAPSTRLFGNQKLAARPTTPDEKHQTYIEAFQNVETKHTALKTAMNDNNRILFETRSGSAESCGGYFLIFPSEGYEWVSGKIGELTEDEYDELIICARMFNQVASIEDKQSSKPAYNESWEVSPFDHFNQEGDVLSVLFESGWKEVEGSSKTNISLLRPGSTFASRSAMYDTRTKVFNCFSTSTCFDVGKGYTPAGVFIMLECDNDTNAAYSKLVSLGYGIPKS